MVGLSSWSLPQSLQIAWISGSCMEETAWTPKRGNMAVPVKLQD